MVIQASASHAACKADNSTAPRCTRSVALPGVRFHTLTEWPASMSRSAIADPIWPSPSTLTFTDRLLVKSPGPCDGSGAAWSRPGDRRTTLSDVQY